MKFGAVTCEVVCGGVPLEEHKVEYDTDTRTATCYIESEEGQTFSVRWSEDPYDPRAPKGSVGHVYLDDQSQAGRVLDRGNLLASVSGRNVSDSTEKPFVFSRIETTDRDEDRIAEPLPVGFGTIKLKLCRGSRGPVVLNPAYAPDPVAHESLHELSVKKLKVTQRATLGAAVPVPPSHRIEFVYLDPITQPFITFTFTYRSTSMLQALGVIDYVPDPIPVRPNARAGPSRAGKRPAQEIIELSDDSDDDPEVARALKQLADARKRAKGKQTSVDKKPKIEKGEIIEL